MVLRESSLRQIGGTYQQSCVAVWQFGEHCLCVEETRAFMNDADLKPLGERIHQGCELLEHVRRVEVLPVQCEDERPLTTGLEALADGRVQAARCRPRWRTR